MTEDEVQAKIDEAVSGLKAKNTELLADNKQLKKQLNSGQQIDPRDYEKLEAERDDLKAKLHDETKARAQTVKELETVSAQLKAESEAANRSFLDAQLTDALSKAGVVDPDYLRMARNELALQAQVTFDGKGRIATIGDKDIVTAVKEYEGLNKIIPATPNGGGLVKGNQGGGSSDNTINRAALEQMSADNQAAFFAGGGKLTE